MTEQLEIPIEPIEGFKPIELPKMHGLALFCSTYFNPDQVVEINFFTRDRPLRGIYENTPLAPYNLEITTTTLMCERYDGIASSNERKLLGFNTLTQCQQFLSDYNVAAKERGNVKTGPEARIGGR